MISNNTLNAAYPLAQRLTERGYVVRPIESTVLAELVQAGYMEIPTRGADDHDWSIEKRIVDGSMAKDAMGVIRHDQTMDEVVTVVAKTVQGNLDVARNTVNPVVKSVASNVESYMDSAQNVKGTDIGIVPIFYPELFGDPTLTDMVSRYSETSVRPVDLVFNIPKPITENGLIDLVLTGGPSFDSAIKAYLQSLPDGTLEEVYSVVFGRNDSSLAKVYPTVVDYIYPANYINQPEVLARAILAHLLARNLMNNVPDGVEIGLDNYQVYVSDILAQTGRVLVSMLSRRDVAVRQKLLVGNWPPNSAADTYNNVQIPVNGDVYNPWLEAGGTPEAILGSFVTDQANGYNTLLENRERYQREWERKLRVMNTNKRFNRFNYAMDGLRAAMAEEINAMPEETLMVNRAVYHERLEDNLKRLTGTFYENLYVNVRMVVCNTLFAHTMSLEILRAIDDASADNPGIPIREAALLATIEVVASWVAKLCKLETAPSTS